MSEEAISNHELIVPPLTAYMYATVVQVNLLPDLSFSNILSVVDCGAPVVPRNGSLESYTNTTEGSEVLYSCDPGLVPEGRMRTNCTRNGWSPNPAALSCSVGML